MRLCWLSLRPIHLHVALLIVVSTIVAAEEVRDVLIDFFSHRRQPLSPWAYLYLNFFLLISFPGECCGFLLQVAIVSDVPRLQALQHLGTENLHQLHAEALL